MNTAKRIIAAILETALRIIILLIVVSFVYKAGNRAYDFGYRIFAERPITLGAGRDVIVTIPEDKSVKEIGELLKQHGLIRDARLFFCQEFLSAYHGKLKGGTYTLNTSMTAVEMMAVMAGTDVEEIKNKGKKGTSSDTGGGDGDKSDKGQEEAEETDVWEPKKENISDEEAEGLSDEEVKSPDEGDAGSDAVEDAETEKKSDQPKEEKKKDKKKSEDGGEDYHTDSILPGAGEGKLPLSDAGSPQMIEADGAIDVIDAVVERN